MLAVHVAMHGVEGSSTPTSPKCCPTPNCQIRMRARLIVAATWAVTLRYVGLRYAMWRDVVWCGWRGVGGVGGVAWRYRPLHFLRQPPSAIPSLPSHWTTAGWTRRLPAHSPPAPPCTCLSPRAAPDASVQAAV